MKISLLIHFAVGLFIVFGLLAFAGIALRVSGLSFTPEQDSYRLYAYFSNVSGLTDRAKVSVSGVAVGRVVDIQYDQQEFAAKVTIQMDHRASFITRDASASILTSGLLGEKYIGIQLGADSDVLGDGDYIYDTQSAVVLEDLIGKFLLGKAP